MEPHSIPVRAFLVSLAICFFACKSEITSSSIWGCEIDIVPAAPLTAQFFVDGKTFTIDETGVMGASFGPNLEQPRMHDYKNVLRISCLDTLEMMTSPALNFIGISIYDPNVLPGRYLFNDIPQSGYAYGQFSARGICDGACQTQITDSCSYVEITAFDTIAHTVSGKFRMRKNVPLLNGNIEEKVVEGSFTDLYLRHEPSTMGKVTGTISGTPWQSVFSGTWHPGQIEYNRRDGWFELHASCSWPSGKEEEWLGLSGITSTFSGTFSLWPQGGSFVKTLDTSTTNMGSTTFVRTVYQSRVREDGSITIDSYDRTYHRASGSFSAKVYNSAGELVEIKNGRFKDLPVTEEDR